MSIISIILMVPWTKKQFVANWIDSIWGEGITDYGFVIFLKHVYVVEMVA